MFHAVLPANTPNTFKITCSQPNHPSLSKWSIVCTRQDHGMQYSILQYFTLGPSRWTFTRFVTVSVPVSKMELFFFGLEWKSMDSVAGISYCVTTSLSCLYGGRTLFFIAIMTLYFIACFFCLQLILTTGMKYSRTMKQQPTRYACIQTGRKRRFKT